MLDHSWSLIHPKAVALPVIIRCRQQYLDCLKFITGLHLPDIQIGNLRTYADLLRPHIIMLSILFENCGIQRKSLEREKVSLGASHLTFLHPLVLHWIRALAFQDIGTDIKDIIGLAASIIDIPFSKKKMHLRRPDIGRHQTILMFSPDIFFLCLLQAVQGFGTAQYNSVISRNGSSKVIPSVFKTYKGIRSLQNPRFVIFYFLFC